MSRRQQLIQNYIAAGQELLLQIEGQISEVQSNQGCGWPHTAGDIPSHEQHVDLGKHANTQYPLVMAFPLSVGLRVSLTHLASGQCSMLRSTQ